jgi:tetratricopeptide (TPR) repeat protein
MRTVLALGMMLFAAEADAKWLRAESKHFVGYLDGRESTLREHIERLERFDHLLRKRLAVGDDEGQTKLTVFFVDGVTDVRSLYGGNGRNVNGFYTSSLSGGIAIVPAEVGGGRNSMNSDVILFHEYVHHFMLRYFRGAPPAWYAEGFAELLSTTRFDEEGRPQVGLPAQHRAWSLFSGRDVPIRRLLTSTTNELKSGEGDVFYGRAWLLTHYLLFEIERAGQLSAYLTLISQGNPSLQSAESAFGNIDVLERDMDRYVAKNKFSYTTLSGLEDWKGSIMVTTLSQGEDAAMMLKIAMTRGTYPDDAADQAKRMRKIAAKFPTDAEVLTLLAEAESDARNWDAAIAAADQALTLDEQLSRAHLWKGFSMMEKLAATKDMDTQKWRQARASIVRANRINTEDAAPLFYYYMSFLREGVKPTQIAIDGLGKARSLVPQFPLLTLQYATALASGEKYAEARAILQPLANAPHDNGYKRVATKMIEQIRASDAGQSQNANNGQL